MASNANQGSIRLLDTQAFAQAKQEFPKAITEYIEGRKQLADATNNLLASWRGEGRQTFQNKYNLFSGKLDDLQSTLDDYCKSFTEILDAYDETDESIASGISQSNSTAAGGGSMGGRGGGGGGVQRF